MKRIIILNKIILIAYRANRLFIISIMFLTILSSCIPYLSIIVIQYLINIVQNQQYDFNMVFSLSMFYILLAMLNILINNLQGFLIEKYKDYLYFHLNCLVLEKTKYFTLKDFENPLIYDMLQRAEQEAGNRPYLIIHKIIQLISNIISIVIASSILVIWHKWILLGLIILPILSSIYFFRINKEEFMMRINRTTNERISWYISNLLNKDFYIKEIKTYNLTEYLYSKFKEIRFEFHKQNNKYAKKRMLFTLSYQLLTLLFNALIFLIAVIETYFRKIQLGNLVTYINTVSKVDHNVKNVVSNFFGLYQDSLYASQFIDFLEYKIFIPDESNVKINCINKIELRNVSYKYENCSGYALYHINLILNKGVRYVLVGENGSGKSTLIKILTGLYTDYSGQIFINGIPFSKINLDSYRECLSTVFQDYNQYQFTVKENIGFGNIDNINNINKIKQASIEANCDEFINKLPNKYDQQVGQWFSGGIQLSGGQWQKLAIARGLIRTADLYILDEPTSSLDPKSEYSFFENFLKFAKHSISLIVTHRFTNAKFADQIIVFDKGKLVEMGCHNELMKLKGHYYKLFKFQNSKMKGRYE